MKVLIKKNLKRKKSLGVSITEKWKKTERENDEWLQKIVDTKYVYIGPYTSLRISKRGYKFKKEALKKYRALKKI